MYTRPSSLFKSTLVIATLLLGTIHSLTASAITFFPSTSFVLDNSTFTVDVYGSSVNIIGGFSLYLNSSAGEFSITQQDLNQSLFTYGGPSPSFPNVISSTLQSEDLGAFSIEDLNENTTYFLGTDTIHVGTLAPGFYSIGNTSGTVFSTPDFMNSDYAAANSFTIAVFSAPEPSSWKLLLLGTCLILAWRLIRRTTYFRKNR